jgi:Ni,Fe-hydrogenase III large subunit
MTRHSVLPFGPQHPVLPEPLQLRLELEDEKVVGALPVLGYIHRGLEKIAENKDFHQNVYLIERICGICSFIHATAYCQAVETLMDLEVPPRAKYLRLIWSELHRIHSHLLWLGLLADSFGYENLFMQLWRCREDVLDVLERWDPWPRAPGFPWTFGSPSMERTATWISNP